MSISRSEIALPADAPMPTLTHESSGYLVVGPSPVRGVWIARRSANARLALYKWAARASDVDGSVTRLEESVRVECTSEHFDEKKHVPFSMAVVFMLGTGAMLGFFGYKLGHEIGGHHAVTVQVQELRCARLIVTGGVARCER